MEFAVPNPPLDIFFLPAGVYGVSFEISTTEDELLVGWNSSRRELILCIFDSQC